MARSAGDRPKRQSKKAYDPEFLYDFPPSSFFHEDFDLEEKGDTLQHVQSAKQSKTSKSKPATVPATSPPPIFPEDSASFLTYDQQLQLIQLQKEKLELELKVLSLSHRERPQEHMLEGLTEEVNEPAAQRRVKRSIDWPHNFVPSIQGEYDKLNLSEFVSGFLIMIKTYDVKLKEAFLVHLELLMIKAISYSWSSVRAFHKFVAKQVEQRCLEGTILKQLEIRQRPFFAILTFDHPHLMRICTITLGLPAVLLHQTTSRRLSPARVPMSRRVSCGIIPPLATVTNRTARLIENIIVVVFVRLIIPCCIVRSAALQFRHSDY